MKMEERCACGASISVECDYKDEVDERIATWRKEHRERSHGGR